MVSSVARAGDTATASFSFKFTRAHRLLNATDFQHVFDKAQRSQDRYLTVLFRANDRDQPRLGFAIAKKVIPRAVRRNRLRRLCRESFRLNYEQLGAVDIIILARRPADAASNDEIFASLKRHWQRLQERQEKGPDG